MPKYGANSLDSPSGMNINDGIYISPAAANVQDGKFAATGAPV